MTHWGGHVGVHTHIHCTRMCTRSPWAGRRAAGSCSQLPLLTPCGGATPWLSQLSLFSIQTFSAVPLHTEPSRRPKHLSPSLALFLRLVFSHFLRVVYSGFPTLSLLFRSPVALPQLLSVRCQWPQSLQVQRSIIRSYFHGVPIFLARGL